MRSARETPAGATKRRRHIGQALALVALLCGAAPVSAQQATVTVLLDRDGRVGARVIGVLREATLRALLDNLVNEYQPPAPTKTRNS